MLPSDLRHSPIDEPALLAGLRSGNEEAYETLVRVYGGRLLSVARRLLRNEEDARDVVQAAYLNAFRSIGQFEGTSQLSTWLHRIVVNAALMKLRTLRRRPEESIDDLLPAFLEDGHHVEEFSDWAVRADAAVLRAENRAAVRRSIDRLPEHYRSVLLLRDIEELSTQEVAELLGLTPTAVKVRLHRARQALSTLLRRELAGGVTS